MLYAQDGNQQPNAEQYKPRSEKREGEQVEARRESSWWRDRKRKMGRHLEMSFFNVEGISIDRERVRERERQIEAEREREGYWRAANGVRD